MGRSPYSTVPTHHWFMARIRSFLPPAFSGHYMRAGGPTSLAETGADLSTIQAVGHWNSDAFQAYIPKNLVVLHALLFGCPTHQPATWPLLPTISWALPSLCSLFSFSITEPFFFTFLFYLNIETYIAFYSVCSLEIIFELLWWALATSEVAFCLLVRYSPWRRLEEVNSTHILHTFTD
jgi:hypothetical protein